MKTLFERLIRFRDPSGRILYGDGPVGDDYIGKRTRLYSGTLPWDLQATDETGEIAEVLCPLPSTPIIYGVGLNYKAHIAEGGYATPKFPTIFTNPPDALNRPFSTVLVDPECLHMDYEGELAVVMGQDVKNATPTSAMDHVLGYTIANDVSSRYWQMPEQSGNQHGYAKSFDGFAPVGPLIVSARVADPDRMTIVTRVNGEERQNAPISDLLFKVGDIIAHLSRGTTLRAGTVIMTGTPSGVGRYMKPAVWLKEGDVVEVTVSGIGTIRNRFSFLSSQ
ncbi:fumarylacetoacetate hydrolase family protein [Aspergillus keveii]|uniref:Fumarylacetoacetate hydrolase family protein n=1 Tax=Aspergillus keveii TaxID=714993 RepID=A0ABR4FQP6_9EURO